jgi:GNAT superfamily N-acetyltransferase
LVRTIGEWARSHGVSEVYLHVTTSVPRARAFYEKVGFRPTGESFEMDRDQSLTLITMVQRLD